MIVSKKIPENSRAIAAAREHGDLRENSEYKMAKQDQQILMAQKRQLERDLARARITDFKDAADRPGQRRQRRRAARRATGQTAALHDPRRLGRRPGQPHHLLQDAARPRPAGQEGRRPREGEDPAAPSTTTPSTGISRYVEPLRPRAATVRRRTLPPIPGRRAAGPPEHPRPPGVTTALAARPVPRRAWNIS